MPDALIAIFYQQLAIIAICAHLFGELFRRLGQPPVAGQIFVGIILGPTVLERVCPAAFAYLSPMGDTHPHLQAIANLGAALLLLASGLHIDLKMMRKQLGLSVGISIAGFVLPFLCGFFPSLMWTEALCKLPPSNAFLFATFVGACCALSGLAVSVRMLMDFDLFDTPFGAMITAAIITTDLLSWFVAGAVFFALSHSNASGSHWTELVMAAVGIAVIFSICIPKARLLWVRLVKGTERISSSPSGAIGFILGIGLLAASLTQAMGLDGLLGAFIAGALMGTVDLKESTRQSIAQFVGNFLAPVYFAYIGLTVDFIASFYWPAVVCVLVLSFTSKILGCYGAARCWRVPPKVSLVTGFMMNNRGGMSIILATAGLQAKIIDERMFVAITVTTLLSVVMAGFAMRPQVELLRRQDCLNEEAV